MEDQRSTTNNSLGGGGSSFGGFGRVGIAGRAFGGRNPGGAVLPSGTYAMTTEDIIIFEQHFLSFTEQNGPLNRIEMLQELLWVRCNERTMTREEMEESLLTWDPELGVAMTMKQFIAIVSDIKEKKLEAGPRNLSVPEATSLFYLLSSQSDFIPTRVAVALCAVLDSEAFRENYLDYIGLDGFLSTIEADSSLSRKLAVKRGVIMRGALAYSGTIDHTVSMHSAIPDDSETLESWYRVNDDNIEAVLREAHLMVKKEEDAKLERQRELQAKGKRALLSYFAPEEVIPTGGSTAVNADVKPVVVHSTRAGEALQQFSDETTAQRLVGRVIDLKRLRKQKQEQRAVVGGNDDDDEEEDNNCGLGDERSSLLHQGDRNNENEVIYASDYNNSLPTVSKKYQQQSSGVGVSSSFDQLSDRSGTRSQQQQQEEYLTPLPLQREQQHLSSSSCQQRGGDTSSTSSPERRLFCSYNSKSGKTSIARAEEDRPQRMKLQKNTTAADTTVRLFPHTRTPTESIRHNLKNRIGLSWVPDAGDNWNQSVLPLVADPQYSIIQNNDPFLHTREYREFVPKERKKRTSANKSFFFSPSDNPRVDYNNYSHEMPSYKPPASKARQSASGVRLDLISQPRETLLRAAKAKKRFKERQLREKVMEETGDVLGCTNTEHEASLLLLEARAKLQKSLKKATRTV